MRITACAGLLLMVLSGCADLVDSGSAVATPEESPSASSSFTPHSPAAKSTPSTSREPDLVKFTFECKVQFHAKSSVEFENLEAVWDYAEGREVESCTAHIHGSAFSDEDKNAVAIAGYDSLNSLGTLYELCAQVDGSIATEDRLYSQAQLDEARAMLYVCPEAPHAQQVADNIEVSEVAEKQRTDGERFGNGLYQVGEEIKPGTYVLEGTVEDCYWERLDNAGEIIENNFILAANRVEVTVASSDFSFHSKGCAGEWYKE